MKDKWKELFALQQKLADMYAKVRPTPFYTQDPILRCPVWTRSITHEACELEDELNWKPWKNPVDLQQNRAHRLEETADILHFFLQLCIDQGFSAEEVFDAYVLKRDENIRRQMENPLYKYPKLKQPDDEL